MFPQLNNIFRKKNVAEVNTLKIPINSRILDSVNIDVTQFEKDTNDNILINTSTDKLNVIGAHFASINNRRLENNRPQFNRLVDVEVNTFKDNIKSEWTNEVTLCIFNDDNKADNPNLTGDLCNYFINDYDLTLRLKKSKNKKSYGLDKIPNSVLKRIPPNLILNYTIIFNNLLNYSFFLENWKTTKVIAILKKDKDHNLQVIDL
ncbi:hypothetical protein P5V15_012827 [Pogonomyrmex californicus]